MIILWSKIQLKEFTIGWFLLLYYFQYCRYCIRFWDKQKFNFVQLELYLQSICFNFCRKVYRGNQGSFRLSCCVFTCGRNHTISERHNLVYISSDQESHEAGSKDLFTPGKIEVWATARLTDIKSHRPRQFLWGRRKSFCEYFFVLQIWKSRGCMRMCSLN